MEGSKVFMITNPRIERKKADIARTEVKFAEVKARLRAQKLELIDLEDMEIVAMFRKDVITEDDFIALRRSRQEAGEEYDGYEEDLGQGGEP
jgi:hypothetical protein